MLLQTLDHLWREHLVMLEHLRQVIGLRGYGQRDPLNEYKAEAFNLFEAMGHEPARGGDRAAHAHRDRARRRRRSSRTALYGGAPRRPGDRRGPDGAMPTRRWRRPSPATATAARAASAIPTIRRAGARSAATKPAPAAPARSTSTATAASGNTGSLQWPLLSTVFGPAAWAICADRPPRSPARRCAQSSRRNASGQRSCRHRR